MSTNIDSKKREFFTSRNIAWIAQQVKAKILATTGQPVEVTPLQLRNFMIQETQTSERSPVSTWNLDVVNYASRNILTNMKLRRTRIQRQSRHAVSRPLFRSVSDTVRGTHSRNTLDYIGRPSKARTERNAKFE